MNISLNWAIVEPDHYEGGEAVESSIEEHRKIMEHVGFNLTGNTVLQNEPAVDGNAYPGSYRVWLETTSDTWIYVDPEGNAHEIAFPKAASVR